jgi:hypothetical protein
MKFSNMTQKYKGFIHEAFAVIGDRHNIGCEWKLWISPEPGKFQLYVERPELGPKLKPIPTSPNVWNLTPSQFSKWLYSTYTREDVLV